MSNTDSSSSTSPSSIRRKVVLAGHTGDVSTARAGLSHPDGTVRASAVTSMDRLHELTQADLESALTDTDPAVRLRAAETAARWTAGVRGLVGLLQDPDDRVTEQAAFALGERESSAGVVAALSGVTRDHRDSLCREAAVAALGSLEDPAGLDAVLVSCGDKASVRRRAVLSLAAFRDPLATEMLRSLTRDRDLQVRQAAEDLLAIEEGEELGGPVQTSEDRVQTSGDPVQTPEDPLPPPAKS